MHSLSKKMHQLTAWQPAVQLLGQLPVLQVMVTRKRCGIPMLPWIPAVLVSCPLPPSRKGVHQPTGAAGDPSSQAPSALNLTFSFDIALNGRVTVCGPPFPLPRDALKYNEPHLALVLLQCWTVGPKISLCRLFKTSSQCADSNFRCRGASWQGCSRLSPTPFIAFGWQFTDCGVQLW